MQRRTFFVTEARKRHIPLRTARIRFRVHRSPVLAAMTSRGEKFPLALAGILLGQGY